MRDTVATLPVPDASVLRIAAERPPGRDQHDQALADIRALRCVEVRPVERPPAPPATLLRVAAWNLERGRHFAAAAELLRQVGASVVLLSEMDLGMARSGNRHTTRDLADALGAGYAFGVEFAELGLGFGRELVDTAGLSNAASLHGNAVVSMQPFRDPFVIPLDDGGHWFDLGWHHRRIGGRTALGVTIDGPSGPVVLVSLHLESDSRPDDRCRAMERLLAGLETCAPNLPTVVAGDLNVAEMPDPAREPDLGWFTAPQGREPLFALMAEAGFDWRHANTPEQTRRWIPDGRRRPWTQRIDWVFTRDLTVRDPRTWPAIDSDGAPLSDHELITLDLDFA